LVKGPKPKVQGRRGGEGWFCFYREGHEGERHLFFFMPFVFFMVIRKRDDGIDGPTIGRCDGKILTAKRWVMA